MGEAILVQLCRYFQLHHRYGSIGYPGLTAEQARRLLPAFVQSQLLHRSPLGVWENSSRGGLRIDRASEVLRCRNNQHLVGGFAFLISPVSTCINKWLVGSYFSQWLNHPIRCGSLASWQEEDKLQLSFWRVQCKSRPARRVEVSEPRWVLAGVAGMEFSGGDPTASSWWPEGCKVVAGAKCHTSEKGGTCSCWFYDGGYPAIWLVQIPKLHQELQCIYGGLLWPILSASLEWAASCQRNSSVVLPHQQLFNIVHTLIIVFWGNMGITSIQ